ncbi:MAG: hypothetical protein ACLGIA_03385 [Actinomycetes bacterium]
MSRATASRLSTPHGSRRPSGPATAPAGRGRRRGAAPVAPLGSLTQTTSAGRCHACGTSHVTRLALQLTDGTPVRFTSCHRCETRRWDHDGVELSVDAVLEHSRKTA